MASASFGCVGHARPALWSRGCYCKHKGTGSSVFYAGWSGFLRFCDAVHVPPLLRCPPAVHIGRCTNKAGKHSRRSCPRFQPRSCACSIVLAHRPAPNGEGTHKRDWPPVPLSQDGFLRDAILFFKSISKLSSKGLVLLYLYDTAGDPKSK